MQHCNGAAFLQAVAIALELIGNRLQPFFQGLESSTGAYESQHYQLQSSVPCSEGRGLPRDLVRINIFICNRNCSSWR